ncbi:MAG: ATP-dependent helicase [Microbacteriaceae bacterium]|nr:ATP-dependent helicase [Microbacteriaceae bacterium]
MSAAAPAGDLLAGLDDEQRVAAEALLGPVCILAGAGTGKTRVLTHRIAHGVATGVYDPARVLALTFTTRAAGELRGRLRALGASGVSARTFHSAALAQLGHFWPQVIGGTAPRILEGKARLLVQAAEQLRLKVDTAALRDAAAEIEWRKVRRLTLGEYARLAPERSLPPGIGADAMVALQDAYEQIKDSRRRLDFEDVLLVTAGMLDAEPAIAEQVRAQYRFFVVDEYQDVSPLQQELLELWLGERTDVCVVGDASQTIYSFAGATSAYLLGFGARYPDARVVRLETNHRSAEPVLHAANRLMRGHAGALELVSADRRPGPPVEAPAAYDDDRAEAEAVAAAVVADIRAGVRPADIAVLYRVNAQAPQFEKALADAGVAARVAGATPFFELDVIKRAMLELRSVARTRATGEPAPLWQAVSDVLRGAGWTQQAPESGGAVRERWEALSALLELAEHAPAGTALPAFVDELFDRQAAQHEPVVAAVTLSTLHSAKGLEWDVVHIAGLSEGLLPISYARDAAGLDEERRLLYVGITRARRRLRLSWARRGLRGQDRAPSRFLAELSTGIPDASTPSRR